MLTDAMHDSELEASENSIVIIAYKNNGIGTNSCGPRLPEMYKFKEREFTFEYEMNVKSLHFKIEREKQTKNPPKRWIFCLYLYEI